MRVRIVDGGWTVVRHVSPQLILPATLMVRLISTKLRR